MARSYAKKAAGRTQKADDVIRAALTAGDSRKALNAAIAALQSEARKLRRRRPADAFLVDAELAASIRLVTADLIARRPPRSQPARAVPPTERMLAVFERTLAGESG